MSVVTIKKPMEKKKKDILELRHEVSKILKEVQDYGDTALFSFSEKFDAYKGKRIKVTKEQISAAYNVLDEEVIDTLKEAASRIERFAKLQKNTLLPVEQEVSPGVILGHHIIPVSCSGAYVPGGRYPLPSSALMSIIPARVAGVERIVACSPPDDTKRCIHPATLVAMDIAGADEIYCMGGAQAIAALAYGTESILPVDTIVGPGNQWVTEAKRQVYGTTGIDFIAGPSEVLIIADETSNPRFIAADLLAQSEHDTEARGILISTDNDIIKEVLKYIEEFLQSLPTRKVAQHAWEANGEIYLVDSLKEAAKLSNKKAPEHLELHIQNPKEIISDLKNYGSLFEGSWGAEVFGDYVSGTNHILPTMGASRYTGGVWVGTFLKVVSFQKINRKGAIELSPIAAKLAELEGLWAHKLAADLRKV